MTFARGPDMPARVGSPTGRHLTCSQELLYVEEVTVEWTQSLWRRKVWLPVGENGWAAALGAICSMSLATFYGVGLLFGAVGGHVQVKQVIRRIVGPGQAQVSCCLGFRGAKCEVKREIRRKGRVFI